MSYETNALKTYMWLDMKSTDFRVIVFLFLQVFLNQTADEVFNFLPTLPENIKISYNFVSFLNNEVKNLKLGKLKNDNANKHLLRNTIISKKNLAERSIGFGVFYFYSARIKKQTNQ